MYKICRVGLNRGNIENMIKRAVAATVQQPKVLNRLFDFCNLSTDSEPLLFQSEGYPPSGKAQVIGEEGRGASESPHYLVMPCF